MVLLKVLEKSGLLMVTGPYAFNGVPLRRVNASFVIATSTKVDVSGVDVSKFDDAYFEAQRAESEPEETGTEGEEAPRKIPESRIEDQKAVDAAIVASVESDAILKAYLGARFSLTKGQAPHAMKF